MGTRPANGSVVSGCGSVGSWLSSVGSVTVYTPDTQEPRQRIKDQSTWCDAADIIGSGAPIDRQDMYEHTYIKTRTGEMSLPCVCCSGQCHEG